MDGDNNDKLINGGGGINPAALPLDQQGFVPPSIHTALCKSTRCRVARAAGLRTRVVGQASRMICSMGLQGRCRDAQSLVLPWVVALPTLGHMTI